MPPQPVRTHAADPEASSFDVVRINPQGDRSHCGPSRANGSEVTITDAGKEVGRTKADLQGDWVFVPSAPLPPGARELTLAQRPPDGSETKSDRTVLLVVPEVPAAGTATATNATTPLAVMTSPNAPPLILTGPGQTPSAATADGSRLALGAAEYNDHGKISFSGSAPPGSTVRLYVDDRPIGQAVANPNGQWSFSTTEMTRSGTHRLRLDQIAPNGTVCLHAGPSALRESNWLQRNSCWPGTSPSRPARISG